MAHVPMTHYLYPRPASVASAVSLFPTLATDHAHASRSESYVHINTLHTLQALESAGYGVTSVALQRVRTPDRVGFAKHAITVRPFDARPMQRVGDTFVEARIVNAHDGSSAFKIYTALLRLVCSNGMTAGKAFSHYTVRHSGANLEARVVDATDARSRTKKKARDFALGNAFLNGHRKQEDTMASTNDKIRGLMDACGSRWMTVDVVLKDGTRRSITFNPRETRPLLTETPTPAGLKAAETRRENNPTLINVWDRGIAKLRKYGKPGPSSFYLDRVIAVRTRGETHELRVHRPHIVELSDKD